ncbi:MAG TPA: hypothetical protein VFF73_01200 [Planctomycetota bacterium]|nr:hypothetical protein [Planctomycetota bacterium]
MSSFFKIASAAALSLFVAGGAYADGFDGVTFRTTEATLMAPSTTFSVDKDGKYTITTDGGMAHFVRIDAQGQLSAAQLKSLENALDKMAKANPVASMPGLVPGSPEFSITYGGKTINGAVNFKAAIEDATQNGNEEAAIIWKPVEPVLKKMTSLETSLQKNANPVAPDPAKKDKAPFDELQIQTRNSWTGATETLTVKSDGSYTLDRGLGQSPLSGSLSSAQLSELEKAYSLKTVKAENGKMVGGLIPDDTTFRITATEGGQSYWFTGSVDSGNLGPVAKLEKALVGDANVLQPPVAKPLADPAAKDNGPSKTDGLIGGVDKANVADAAKAAAATLGSRGSSAGADLVKARVDGAKDAADGKDAASER